MIKESIITSFEIPIDLHQRLKVEAAMLGVTLKALMVMKLKSTMSTDTIDERIEYLEKMKKDLTK